MIGVIADTLAVLIGGTIGFLAKKIIPENWNDIVMKGLGLCSIYIGISGALKGENMLILIVSISIGAMIGQGLQIEERFNRFAAKIENRFSGTDDKSNLAQGFVTSSLIMCVGALSIVGSLNAGLQGDNTLLFTKTALDFIGAIMFSASLGAGVIFSAITVFVFHGSIVMLSGVVAPIMTSTLINEIACVGSIVLLATGFNMALETKFKILNYMPAIFLPVFFCPVADWISGLL